ncbi:MAG: response regulator [Proteobacteria bacterium]|nr:response regulator [Pseudomonadota bacterium]
MAGAKDLLQYSKGLALLYVEDDDRLRADTLRLLSTFFDDIVVAENGEEGLGQFEPGRFDLVISDLVMPIVGGAEMAEGIKAIDPHQTIVILSAHDEKSIIQKLENTGIDEFIFKPLEIQHFINTLYDICRALSEAKGK